MLKINNEVSYKDIVKDYILNQKLGAIYQGKSECGPRALGNRSIIFDPRISNGKEIVNRVKKRERFRPFAATVLEEESHKWFDMIGITSSPFMTFAFNILEHKKDQVPSIVHVDNTCRIQTINEKQNKIYYNLIKTFFEFTGVPMLLNTSFNLAGNPMVEDVTDAIETLYKSELDYVYFPELNLLVSK
jgi:carbamoyltransferase